MKRILLLLGLGALFTAFNLFIGGVDFLPDWLGSLFFALGVTGLGRRGGESLSTPAVIAWVLFVTEVVSVLCGGHRRALCHSGGMALSAGSRYPGRTLPRSRAEHQAHLHSGRGERCGLCDDHGIRLGHSGGALPADRGCHEGLVHGTARKTLQNRGGLKTA